VSFRVRLEDEPELQRFYDEQLWPFLRGLEERARDETAGDAPIATTRLSVFWATRDDADSLPVD
jgi:hypothetical protein